ncbi:AAA family ATPase [Pararhizobium sp. DWP3-4]|uniref:ATP-binding protein n=1 Tax=Pararhizobium sp. DWP3-4 TaxID=2804565 RepID=UPI003CECA592
MTTEELRALKKKVRSQYIENGRDEQVADHLNFIVSNIDDFHAGAASQRRCLFVIGPSGSGKTTALEHHFKKIPQFQPFVRELETVKPLISLPAPKQSPTKDLIVAVLKTMNLPHKGSEQELTALLKEQAKERSLIALHIDEGQHAIRSNTPKAIKGVQDFLKNLMAIPDWPLHLIISGMPEVDNMRIGDGQMERRSHVLKFEPMEYPDDLDWLKTLLHNVAVQQCSLKLSDAITSDEFLGRLCRAMNGGWGSIIEMVQEACFVALANGRTTLTINHFAYRYDQITACKEGENMFHSPRWNELKPKFSLMDLQEVAE